MAVALAQRKVPLASAYESAAAKSDSAERQRYCLDIARELYFLGARDAFYTRSAAGPYPRLLTAGPASSGYTLGDTLSYWKNAKLIDKFIESYGSGRLEEVIQAAGELQKTLPQQ